MVTFRSDPGFVHERLLLRKLTYSSGVVYTPGGDMYEEGTPNTTHSDEDRQPTHGIGGKHLEAWKCLPRRLEVNIFRHGNECLGN